MILASIAAYVWWFTEQGTTINDLCLNMMFLNVVSTQINLYNAQINYWEALSNAKSALAALAAAVGEEALYE